MNSTMDRLPAAIDAEKYILGALIAFPDCAGEVFRKLKSTDFVDGAHSVLFDRMAKQHSDGGIDTALLAANLREHKEFGEVSAAGLLFELAKSVATRVHVPAECKKIIEARKKRQLFDIANTARDGALNGRCADDILGALSADLWEFGRDCSGKPRYEAIEAADLASGQYELRYLIDHILVEGQPGFLGGPKKALKTSLALDLSLSLATAGYFLGKFKVNAPRRVLFLSGESGLATLQETAWRICRAMGVDLASLEGFTLCTTLPRLQNDHDLADCERFIGDTGAEVVITDPLYLAFIPEPYDR